MRLNVREVDPRVESGRLLAVLQREFEDWGGREKFDWLYLDNPAGVARTWVLEDAPHSIVGVSSAFPRILRSKKGTLRAWVLGDFCIDKAQRALGPALKLQHAALEGVDRDEVDLFYDFPSRVMASVYRRMGVKGLRRLERFVRPLSLDRWVEGKIGGGAVAKGIAAVGNTVLRVQEAALSRDETVSVQVWSGELDARFEGLQASLADGVHVDRTPSFLEWRYRREPGSTTTILVAERDKELTGYLAMKRGGGDALIVDACGTSSAVVRELILEVLERARGESLATVSIALSEGHPWTACVSELGFQRRDEVPFVVYAGTKLSEATEPWYLMSADRDV